MKNNNQEPELSAIKQIELRAAAIPGVISLAQGIPSFDTPEPIKNRVIEAINNGLVAKYSLAPGMIELREAIEESLFRQGMNYNFENEIIVTAGSIEAIAATLLALASTGDEIIILSPSYVSYAQAIKLAGAKPVYVALDEENEWSLNVAALAGAVSAKTKAIIICHPNNPTGTIFNKQQLLAVAELAQKKNFFIVIDEVYKDFLYEEADRQNYFSLAMAPEFRRQVIRIFSFSKAYAMTGWRIGYLHTDKSLAEKILKVHDNLVTCAPVVSQYAALAALSLKPAEWKIYRDAYLSRRDIMCQHLDKLSEYLSYVKPKSAYFTFPKIKKDKFKNYTDSLNFALHLLDNERVAVVPGSAFGPTGEDHFRLSFGRTESDIIMGMQRLAKHFTTHA